MKRFSEHSLPRWIIFLIDISIVVFSVILAYLVRFNFEIPDSELKPMPNILLYIIIVRALGYLIFKTYASIIRYTSTQDAIRILLVISAGSLMFVFTNLGTYYLKGFFFIPFSIIIIDYLASTFALVAYRILTKITFLEIQNPNREKSNVIIFGAGESGVITKRTLDRDAGVKNKVLAFIDDDIKKPGKKLEGVSIFSSDKLEHLIKSSDVTNLIISPQKMNSKRKDEIVELCLAHNIKVLNVPPVTKWINGELSFKQIKQINIEDLLGRDTINLDKEQIGKELAGKTILITGASGSIGSEIVRQVSYFSHKKIILVDQAETPIYHIDIELTEHFPKCNYEIVLSDIRNTNRMRSIFNKYKPDIVYHAAAYKHVPMMENNPHEALLTNIEGTKTIADLAIEFNVKKFVMISTDKAVNPTSVMGASKRIAEIYVQSLNKKEETIFITTRFGNVLGSNGSVIPLFRKQIQKGGPITITHPEITRFFMTIPEACQLVLEAGTMSKGGEIFIFNMGQSIKILDLAKKMIKLSGLTLGKDIQIIYTGLRPGEKLYEELLNNQENTLPTHHPLIMIAKVKEYGLEIITKEINDLISMLGGSSNFDLVSKMKQIVPEFKSQNSIYEQLDTVDV